MVDEYAEPLADAVDLAAPLDLRTPVVHDIARAFDNIPQSGSRFACSVADTFFADHRSDRYREVTNPGRNRTDNHLQGIQRFGDRLYLSAGDLMEGRAHLFIAKYHAAADGAPSAELVRVVSLDERRDHSGGMQRLGDVLAIAIEGHNITSTVVFLHLADPDRPQWIHGARIERDDPKASAAALCTLPCTNGDRVLAGVTWVKKGLLFGKLGSKAFLDLYLSRTSSLHDGFHPQHVRVDISRLTAGLPAWQSIAFLPPQTSSEIMLIGTRSSSSAPGGTGTADLCRLHFSHDPAVAWPTMRVSAQTVRSRTFNFRDGYGDFAAAAGIDIDERGAISLLAAGHFRFADGFRIAVCS